MSLPETKGQHFTFTWDRKRVGIIVLVALVYALWFNLLDSVAYCYDDPASGRSCKSMGQIFGGNQFYQP